MDGAFAWARRALNSQNRRVSARAEEYKELDTTGAIMFPVGCSIVIGGVMVLTLNGMPKATVLPDEVAEVSSWLCA